MEKGYGLLHLFMGISVVSGLGKRIPTHITNGKEEERRNSSSHDPICIGIISVLSIILTSLALYKIYRLCYQLFRPTVPLTRPEMSNQHQCACSRPAVSDPRIMLSTAAVTQDNLQQHYEQLRQQQQAILNLTLLNLNLTECPCSYLHHNKDSKIVNLEKDLSEISGNNKIFDKKQIPSTEIIETRSEKSKNKLYIEIPKNEKEDESKKQLK